MGPSPSSRVANAGESVESIELPTSPAIALPLSVMNPIDMLPGNQPPPIALSQERKTFRHVRCTPTRWSADLTGLDLALLQWMPFAAFLALLGSLSGDTHGGPQPFAEKRLREQFVNAFLLLLNEGERKLGNRLIAFWNEDSPLQVDYQSLARPSSPDEERVTLIVEKVTPGNFSPVKSCRRKCEVPRVPRKHRCCWRGRFMVGTIARDPHTNDVNSRRGNRNNLWSKAVCPQDGPAVI